MEARPCRMHGTGALLQVWGTAATGTRVDTRAHTGTDGEGEGKGKKKKRWQRRGAKELREDATQSYVYRCAEKRRRISEIVRDEK